MKNQSCRILLLAVHQQDNQLAITVGGPMIGTLTLEVRPARRLEIEGLHGAKPRFGQRLADQTQGLFAVLFHGQKRR
jgi:hypothetical protein